MALEPARPSGAEETPGFWLREAHTVVHQLERRLRGAPCLLGTERKQPLQLALIRTKGFEPFADRRQELDDRFAHRFLQVAVARTGEALLERLDRLACRDAH